LVVTEPHAETTIIVSDLDLAGSQRAGIMRDVRGKRVSVGSAHVIVQGDRNMGTSASKEKPPASKLALVHATALPPPYQLAIEDVAFQMTILEDHIPRAYDCECAVRPATWFSVTLTAPISKRYLYLVQTETDTGLVVLLMLYDRSAADDDSSGLRLPPSGAWLRAVVDGAVYVIASDLVLTRKSITAWIGGDEPPTTPAKPPYT
jgi:hypothetical protein